MLDVEYFRIILTYSPLRKKTTSVHIVPYSNMKRHEKLYGIM